MNRMQIFRSSVAGARPIGRFPGELAINWPDKQLSVVDAANQPLDLVAVRYFSVEANYAIGDFVVEAGEIWRAIVAVTPAPFDPAQWASIGGAAGDFVTDAELTAILANYATDADLAGYLPLAGGTLSGPLTLAADAAAPMQAVPYQQLAAYAEWAGGDFTGPITGTDADFSGSVTGNPFTASALPGEAAMFGLDAEAGEARTLAAYTSGVLRWGLQLADGTPESGGNSGSDCALIAYDDAGGFLGSPMLITRATGQAQFSGGVNTPTIDLLTGGTPTSRIYLDATNGLVLQNLTVSSFLFLDNTPPGNLQFIGGAFLINGAPAVVRSDLDDLREQIQELKDELAALRPQPKGPQR